MSKSVHNLIPKGMSGRPEYYSGRGATITDLDSDKLFNSYQKIKENVGVEASKNFIEMVKNLKVASATSFLNAFYELASNDWKFNKNPELDKDEIPTKDLDCYIIGTIEKATKRKNSDMTLSIVQPFLNRFGEKHCTFNTASEKDIYLSFYGRY